MQTARLFQHEHGQAVQLPPAWHFPGTAVYVKHVGTALVLLPMDHPWEPLLTSLELFSDDFMAERSQPSLEARDDTCV